MIEGVFNPSQNLKVFQCFLITLTIPIDMMDHKILWLSVWLGRWRRVVWSIKPWTKKYGAYRDNSAVNIANDTDVRWWLMLRMLLTGIVGILPSFSVVFRRRSESVYLLGFPTKVSNQRYIVFRSLYRDDIGLGLFLSHDANPLNLRPYSLYMSLVMYKPCSTNAVSYERPTRAPVDGMGIWKWRKLLREL